MDMYTLLYLKSAPGDSNVLWTGVTLTEEVRTGLKHVGKLLSQMSNYSHTTTICETCVSDVVFFLAIEYFLACFLLW